MHFYVMTFKALPWEMPVSADLACVLSENSDNMLEYHVDSTFQVETLRKTDHQPGTNDDPNAFEPEILQR
jgi:hypothetical protein